jgi:signal transduction histidine kinase
MVPITSTLQIDFVDPFAREGLIGMRERLEMVGGTLTVLSAPVKGATIRAEVPTDRVAASR